jgi:hypothetical protein
MVSYAREGFNEDAAIRVGICERGRFWDRLHNGIRRTPHKCGTEGYTFLNSRAAGAESALPFPDQTGKEKELRNRIDPKISN